MNKYFTARINQHLQSREEARFTPVKNVKIYFMAYLSKDF
jgi:hypothetical protein